MNGIGQFLTGLLERKQQEEDQLKTEMKQSRALSQVVKSYADPETPEGQEALHLAETGSLEDKQGYVQAQAIKAQVAKEKAQMARDIATTEQLQAPKRLVGMLDTWLNQHKANAAPAMEDMVGALRTGTPGMPAFADALRDFVNPVKSPRNTPSRPVDQLPTADDLGMMGVRAAVPDALKDMLRYKEQMAQQGGADVMPVAKKVGGRDLIVNPKSGVFQDVTQQSASQIPDGFVALGASVDENGKLDVRYGPPPDDETKLPTPTDQAFFQNAQELQAKLDDLESIIEKHGNWESAIGDADTKSKLLQYPYSIAINYAKVVDPNSVAREGEVAAAQKYMIPMGFWTRNDLSKAAIKSMRAEMTRRVKTYNESQKPGANAGEAAATPTRFESAEAALAAAQAGKVKKGDVVEVYDSSIPGYKRKKIQ